MTKKKSKDLSPYIPAAYLLGPASGIIIGLIARSGPQETLAAVYTSLAMFLYGVPLAIASGVVAGVKTRKSEKAVWEGVLGSILMFFLLLIVSGGFIGFAASLFFSGVYFLSYSLKLFVFKSDSK